MRSFGLSLDALRGTLLAACGLSASACTAIPSEPPDEDPASKQPAKTTVEPLPDAEGKPERSNGTACVSPTPVAMDGRDTGYVRCGDGALNRASALACAHPVTAPACQGTEGQRSCETDADCTDKPHGYCMSGSGQIGTYCGCVYPCLDDAECGADEACMCPDAVAGGPLVSSCAPAGCKVDADCPSGECGATFHFNGCYHQLSLQCRSGADGCRGDSECQNGGNCAALERGEGVASVSFECANMTCVIGRPLTVADGVRVASLRAGSWGARDPVARERSAERAAHWLAVARMEHASVASFARFVQELMAFGAPPELLAQALAAAADEVRHAEQTFAIASAYAGEPTGPGPLVVEDLRPTADPELFVTRLIVEACVGETVGVAEALALLEHELAPGLRSVLEGIAADEARHAALAWQTLRWFAPRVDRAVIERAFTRGMAMVAEVGPEPEDVLHGRLGAARRSSVRERALAQVVVPCRDELGRAAAA